MRLQAARHRSQQLLAGAEKPSPLACYQQRQGQSGLQGGASPHKRARNLPWPQCCPRLRSRGQSLRDQDSAGAAQSLHMTMSALMPRCGPALPAVRLLLEERAAQPHNHIPGSQGV